MNHLLLWEHNSVHHEWYMNDFDLGKTFSITVSCFYVPKGKDVSSIILGSYDSNASNVSCIAY